MSSDFCGTCPSDLEQAVRVGEDLLPLLGRGGNETPLGLAVAG